MGNTKLPTFEENHRISVVKGQPMYCLTRQGKGYGFCFPMEEEAVARFCFAMSLVENVNTGQFDTIFSATLRMLDVKSIWNE